MHAAGLHPDCGRMHCMQLSALVGAAAAGALLGRSPQMLAAGAVAGASIGVLAHLSTYRCRLRNTMLRDWPMVTGYSPKTFSLPAWLCSCHGKVGTAESAREHGYLQPPAGLLTGCTRGLCRDEEEQHIAQKVEELERNEAELRRMLEKRARKA